MKKILLVLCAVIFSTQINTAHAIGGPFSSWTKAGDMMLVMTPAYALGLSIMAEDYRGALQLGESVLAGQIASEGIKALELERRPNKKDKKSFPSGHSLLGTITWLSISYFVYDSNNKNIVKALTIISSVLR